MQNFIVRSLVALLLVMPLGAAVADDGFRCGSKIIVVGMTQAEVFEFCGAPTSRTEETVPVRSGPQVVGTTRTQQWTYSSFNSTRVLVFDADKLVSIQ